MKKTTKSIFARLNLMVGDKKMKSDEAKELLDNVFKCFLKESKNQIGDIFYEPPKISVYDEKAVGYKLFIKASIIDESALNCIKSIVQKRKL